jgi:NAD(P)-dependent dehydrogenase (short-subunit alcohol dehydrogenase family)
MDLQLKDKIVFVSGSTAGIGFAIAKRFLQEGA